MPLAVGPDTGWGRAASRRLRRFLVEPTAAWVHGCADARKVRFFGE